MPLAHRGLTQAQALMSPVHGIFDGRLVHDVKVKRCEEWRLLSVWLCGLSVMCVCVCVCLACVFMLLSGEGRCHHRAAACCAQRQGHSCRIEGESCLNHGGDGGLDTMTSTAGGDACADV